MTITQGQWEIGSPCGTLESDSVYQYNGKPYQIYPNVDVKQPDGFYKSVACVYQGNGGVGSPQALAEQLANASLISAAPDLLNAAKAAVSWAETPGNHGGNPYGHDFIKLCIDAIEKAEKERKP